MLVHWIEPNVSFERGVERDDNDNLRELQRPNAAVTAYDDDVFLALIFIIGSEPN